MKKFCMLLGFIGICSGAWAAYAVSDNAAGVAGCGGVAYAKIDRTFTRYYGAIAYNVSLSSSPYYNKELSGGVHNGNGDGHARISVSAYLKYEVEEISPGAVIINVIDSGCVGTPYTKACRDATH